MTDADLAEIEHALEIRLPEDYREVMQDYPFEEIGFTLHDLPNNAAILIRDNKWARESGAYGDFDPLGWHVRPLCGVAQRAGRFFVGVKRYNSLSMCCGSTLKA